MGPNKQDPLHPPSPRSLPLPSTSTGGGRGGYWPVWSIKKGLCSATRRHPPPPNMMFSLSPKGTPCLAVMRTSITTTRCYIQTQTLPKQEGTFVWHDMVSHKKCNQETLGEFVALVIPSLFSRSFLVMLKENAKIYLWILHSERSLLKFSLSAFTSGMRFPHALKNKRAHSSVRLVRCRQGVQDFVPALKIFPIL